MWGEATAMQARNVWWGQKDWCISLGNIPLLVIPSELWRWRDQDSGWLYTNVGNLIELEEHRKDYDRQTARLAARARLDAHQRRAVNQSCHRGMVPMRNQRATTVTGLTGPAGRWNLQTPTANIAEAIGRTRYSVGGNGWRRRSSKLDQMVEV